MIELIKKRWSAEGGYGEVWKIALPLILSTGSLSLQFFIDRVFLTWYSPEAIAASMPAGMLNWTVMCLFVGTAAYTATFVAQYFGAKQPENIGPAVWQGIHIAWITILVSLAFYFSSDALFAFIDHSPEVQALETLYFKILLVGAPFVVVANAISGFFSGLGKTWTVMWCNIAGTIVNLVLDYAWIFGNWGFPEWGMTGAGWATVLGVITPSVLFIGIMLREKYDEEYHTRRGWRINRELFGRLIKYGLPTGLQYMLEVCAFTFFIFMIGKVGILDLAASNIAININSLAFMPMFGLSVAVSVLVGQHLGENKPALAEKATWSAYHMAFTFFGVLGVGYYAFPELFLWPFELQAADEDFSQISTIVIILLKFVALYSLFDAGVMIFSGALKGAGDTRFVAIASVGISWGGMLVPSIYFLYAGYNVYWFWAALTFYVCALCVVFYFRFRQGKWQSMRVIETTSTEGTDTLEAEEASSTIPNAEPAS